MKILGYSYSFVFAGTSHAFLASSMFRRYADFPSVIATPFQSSLAAYDLNTAYEWLSEERYIDPGYSHLQWLDIGGPSSSTAADDKDAEIIPLYPLSAVYLPSSANQTLVNVEPQNIQMALDLLSKENHEDRRFCVVLRATDTGRISDVGTIMRIIEAEHQTVQDELVRIRLTCEAQEIVDIDGILNPEAFGRERRLLKSCEYLQARVRGRNEESFDRSVDSDQDEVVTKLINNFNMIKTIYQLEIGAAGLPPSTLFRLGNAMRTWTVENFQSTRGFWDACQEWQSVCYTIRQGKQAMLSINRNEVMIASVTGPLNLPIHLEDLQPAVRREVEEMEIQAQKEFLGFRLDPCLDFQALLGLPSYLERLQWLAYKVDRERKRLETIATETSQTKRR